MEEGNKKKLDKHVQGERTNLPCMQYRCLVEIYEEKKQAIAIAGKILLSNAPLNQSLTSFHITSQVGN